MEQHDPQFEFPTVGPIPRRTLLRSTVFLGVGLGAAALIGCDDDDDDDGDDRPSSGDSATSTPDAGGNDGDDGDATDGAGAGQLIQDPDLPYPFQFPEPDDKAPKRGGTLKSEFISSFAGLDPTLSQSGSTVTPINPVYNRLVEFVNGVDLDPTRVELQPGLAASWEVAPDGLSYTFRLNEGVKFQNLPPLDGRDFVAQDVVSAYQRLASEGVNQPFFAAVSQISAPDDATVQIDLSTPDPDFLFPLGSRSSGIFPMELVDAGTIETAAIGTGPMILSRYSTDEGAFYEANPDYWKGAPWIDGFELPINKDPGTRLANFRVGQFDYLDRTISDPEGAMALEGTNAGVRIQLENIVAGIQGLIAWDLEDPRFADRRVRQAMSLAVDRQSMIDILWGGVGKALSTLPWPYVFDSEAEADLGQWWRYDPNEARKLLDAVGADDLSFEVLMISRHEPENTLIQSMFKDIGIQMDLNVVETTTRTAQWTDRTWTDAISGFGLIALTANDYFYAQLHSESVLNRARVRDAEIDEWTIAQRSEVDPQVRREVLRNIWDKFHDEVYWIQHPNAFVYNIYQPWLRNIRFGGSLQSVISFYDWGDQLHKVWLDK